MNINEEYTPELKSFIKDLDVIVKQGGSEETLTQSVAERMEELLKHKDILPSNLMQPNPDHYVMYPVYVAPDKSFSIASAVWGINQSTPPHDHGTWGVIGIVQGAEHEIRYTPDNGSNKLIREGDHLLREGEVVVCCTTDQDLHEVSCASSVPCVGLHIYGGDIGIIERRMYNAETGEVKTFVSEWGVPR